VNIRRVNLEGVVEQVAGGDLLDEILENIFDNQRNIGKKPTY